MASIEILPRHKLNGSTRYQVVYRVVWNRTIVFGEFYTQENARRFIARELRPELMRQGVAA